MRTTVTLDGDVEKMLKDAMHRKHSSFKETLNGAIRAGLAPERSAKKRGKFIIEARPLGLRSGIDPAGLMKLNDDLEADEFLKLTRRLQANDSARR
jgi:hypothetical protein